MVGNKEAALSSHRFRIAVPLKHHGLGADLIKSVEDQNLHVDVVWKFKKRGVSSGSNDSRAISGIFIRTLLLLCGNLYLHLFGPQCIIEGCIPSTGIMYFPFRYITVHPVLLCCIPSDVQVD
ncbi:hypothetical protein TNCV_772471 [Trichonephila clavipes]|nr:hypothetical protein TNCV_772471 [Trichonephila clavipes]